MHVCKEDGAYGLKHLLCEGHRDLNVHPVVRRGAAEAILVNAVRRKPFVDKVDALGLRRDETLDLFLGKVLTVAVMEGVAEQKDKDA